MKRVFLIVLDSVGIGAMEDAKEYGDEGTNTLYSVSGSPFFQLDHMREMGLFNIEGIDWTEGVTQPSASYARMKEASRGKDTTIGHWEIAGVISEQPLPTYPDGFPAKVIREFSAAAGRGILCNRPYSGTEVIRDYGDQHVKTGDLIVYTSADSVFQIAAHEEVVPLDQLYHYCEIARSQLKGAHGVGRVIARPFAGESGSYYRTAGRHDYSLKPPAKTMLDSIRDSGQDVIAVGKIKDIFAGQGISSYVYTGSNKEGIQRIMENLEKPFQGLCFINLVDYDMLYGHRNDVDGYAKALTEFDRQIPAILAGLKAEDLLLITADHGCDPGFLQSTDHSREHTPLLMYRHGMPSADLGTRKTFADIAATILDYLDVKGITAGTSLLRK